MANATVLDAEAFDAMATVKPKVQELEGTVSILRSTKQKWEMEREQLRRDAAAGKENSRADAQNAYLRKRLADLETQLKFKEAELRQTTERCSAHAARNLELEKRYAGLLSHVQEVRSEQQVLHAEGLIGTQGGQRSNKRAATFDTSPAGDGPTSAGVVMVRGGPPGGGGWGGRRCPGCTTSGSASCRTAATA